MTKEEAALSQSFVEQQRRRLEALQRQILDAGARTRGSEQAYLRDHGDESHDVGEESEIEAQSEIDEGLYDVNKRRLSDIQRAIAKIEQGTYGFSDVSGEPIPKPRLEVAPESIVTVEEEEQREKRNSA